MDVLTTTAGQKPVQQSTMPYANTGNKHTCGLAKVNCHESNLLPSLLHAFDLAVQFPHSVHGRPHFRGEMLQQTHTSELHTDVYMLVDWLLFVERAQET